MDENRRVFALLALYAAAVGGLATAAGSLFVKRGSDDGAMPGTGTREQQQSRHFPNVAFRTQDGERVRFYDDVVKGKKVLINFMYTECTNTCPRTTANLVKVQEAFGDRVGRDVFFVSISLTPDRDTPAKLKAYAREQGCGEGWTFLTGDMADVDRVRRALGVYDNPDIKQHLGLLTFGNEPEGKWGATNTLGTADHITWVVRNRIDGWTGEPWPTRSSVQEG
jgi:protein SCO1/2